MKRLINKSILVLLCLLLCGAFLPVTAFAAGGSLSGPDTVRAGDNIKLILYASGSNIFGAEGSLSFDSSQVSLTGSGNARGGSWVMEGGQSFILYDNDLTNPINGSAAIAYFTFRVGNVSPGTTINISVSGYALTDGSNTYGAGASYSVAVAAPLSGNNNLSSLSVGNATLSTAFSPTNLIYNAGTVPFSVNSLSVNALAEDPKTTVSVSGNGLVVGRNTVSVAVRAENGSTKTYNINVIREQDPNYVPSSNARLASLQNSIGILSPVFSPDTLSYVIYLPFETEAISLTGTAEDSKARYVQGAESALTVGENPLSVICNAENGDKAEYRVLVVRMPQYNAPPPTPSPSPTAMEPASTQTPAEIAVQTPTQTNETPVRNIPLWVQLLIMCVIAVIAFTAGIITNRFVTKK